jgi:hypothetical protein
VEGKLLAVGRPRGTARKFKRRERQAAAVGIHHENLNVAARKGEPSVRAREGGVSKFGEQQ